MAIICEEKRKRRAEARLSGLMKQIEASCLLVLESGAFRRLPNRKDKKVGKGVKMLAFPALVAPNTHQKHPRPFRQNY